jgi:hypothetical protein
MKALGWMLLFASALGMTMCSQVGPETRAFVLSPAGGWLWVVWLAALVGGVSLIVRNNAVDRPFGRGFMWLGLMAGVAMLIATIAVILPAVQQSKPSTGELDAGAVRRSYAELVDYARKLDAYRDKLKNFEGRVNYLEAARSYSTDASRGDISDAAFEAAIAPSLLPSRSGYVPSIDPLLQMSPAEAYEALGNLHNRLDSYREQLAKFGKTSRSVQLPQSGGPERILASGSVCLDAVAHSAAPTTRRKDAEFR